MPATNAPASAPRDGVLAAEFRIELAGGHQHDHRGAHLEARHLREPREADAVPAPVPPHDGACVGRHDLAAPDRRDAGYQHRPDHGHCEWAARSLEVADQALVAGEQPWNAGDRTGRDAEQAPRNVHGFDQFTFQRHVHAVVVARREVDRHEGAVSVSCGSAGVGKQFGHRVGAALRLQDAAGLDAADLADASVGGREDRVVVALGAARPIAQCTGEKRVEARICERIRLRRFRHVDAVRTHHAADQEVFPGPPGPARGRAHDATQGFVRQQVLGEDGRRHANAIKGEG